MPQHRDHTGDAAVVTAEMPTVAVLTLTGAAETNIGLARVEVKPRYQGVISHPGWI